MAIKLLQRWSASDANRMLGLYDEGIQRAKEALEVYEQPGDTVGQAECLRGLAWLLRGARRLDAAEEAASRAISLLPEKGNQFVVCRCHRGLGDIYSDRVVLEPNLRQWTTGLATWKILAQIFRHTLYPYPKTISILQNSILSFCCTTTRHARVGQKSSDVNDAELPYLEVIVTSVTKTSHTHQQTGRN